MQGLMGGGGCSVYQDEKCFISAYDAATGKLLLEVLYGCQRGRTGRRYLEQSAEPLPRRRTSWITGSYDPELNLTYWGTAQSKPFMQASRQSGSAAVLFGSSTLAIDADTGKLAWYFSHAPGESFDLDIVYERVLVDDGGQNLVFTAGKDGILWKLDRKTGKYLGHKETVFQNIWARFDAQTGEPHYRQDILEQETGQWIQACPSTEGGKNWPAMSHHIPSGRLIIPLSQSCSRDDGSESRLERGRKRYGRRRPAFSRDAGGEGQSGKTGRVRRKDAQ